MKFRTLAGIVVLAILVAACASYAETDKLAAKSNVLFHVGGPFHDNAELYPILQKVLEDTGEFKVTISRDLNEFKAENIKKYDLVIIYCTRQDLTKEQEQGLTGFVESGKGLVGIHCATDTFRDSDAYWKLVGGRFTTHSNGTFKVNITGKSHCIVKGMNPFEITDETYRDEFNPSSKVIVLMRRDMDSEPSAWIQYYGKGRVFVTGLGHGKPAWENPSWQEMIKRASEWATGRLNP